MSDNPAPDQAARDRITVELESTLFVEAGAGSGKTTELVNRVVGLVTSGRSELANIAAITFTDKAAVELRDRIRQQLEQRAHHDPGSETGSRCRAALDQLDSAAIGTLHSFAQRLLSEHPIEAGLPPRVEVLDQVSSEVDFERRWAAFRDQLLADPAYERALLLLFSAGVPDRALRALAVAFNENWDLVEERVAAEAPEPPSVRVVLDRVLPLVLDVCAARAGCRDEGDKLYQGLEAIAGWVVGLDDIDDEFDLLEAVGTGDASGRPSFALARSGRQLSWKVDLGELRDRVKAACAALDEVRTQVAHACAHQLAVAIRRFTSDAAAERRDAGLLEFHDLLVMSRSLVRDQVHGPLVRTQLAARYQRLLLDEFQDTDPIQIELAVRIAALAPDSAEAGEAPWLEVPVAPGHLFMVGDPKQSIYRFRRADVSLFAKAGGRFGSEAGGVVELTANFRSGAPLIGWVNHTFAALMAEPPDTEVPMPSQPDYVALDAVRAGPPTGSPVAVIGRVPHPKGVRADQLRDAEAADVAATIAQVITERWDVDDRDGGWRPARLGDITVLVPARTSLPFLEDALEVAGIPFRAESSSLVYATRAVRDVLMVLRAADNPTNYLRTVAALRTPLLACGDDDLFRFKNERGGSWSYLAPKAGTVPADDPVLAGLSYLRDIYQRRQWEAPAQLLDRIASDRRALELGFAERRPRDVWRRLRFVIDQARAWSDATGGSLRQYLQWVDLQTAEGARVAESVLPESDDDAVRIMTIHAAKGLQFPVTIVSGMSTAPNSRRGPAEIVFPYDGGVGYRFSGAVETLEFSEWKPIDEQMDFHERIRLLYVACTRARDHLVVSIHRKERAKAPKPKARTNSELLVDGMGDALADLDDAGTTSFGYAELEGSRPAPPPPFEEWQAERQTAMAKSSRPSAVAATALTDEGGPDSATEPDPGLQKRPTDLDLPPWLKGRYGSSVGRAVHGVLQTIDLASGAGLDAAVAAQCQAEAIPERANDVRSLVQHALTSPSVREAALGQYWREVYACTPVDGGRLLEGYVDLLYRSPDGLVVVDYKTSSTSDPDAVRQRVEGYRFQGAAYALVVSAATGDPVRRVTFVFLTARGAVECDLPDLDAAVAEVRALVATGHEVVVE